MVVKILAEWVHQEHWFSPVIWSGSYIKWMEKLPRYFLHKNGERRRSLIAVEWLRVCLECPLFDRCSSNNGRYCNGGGRQQCQSHGVQYSSILGSCPSPEMCSNGVVVTREKDNVQAEVKWSGKKMTKKNHHFSDRVLKIIPSGGLGDIPELEEV